ncbi:MAG: TSUP family transporter [Verrucomicrobiota bacterium]|jgi:uncharacterized membrane protein YfcA
MTAPASWWTTPVLFATGLVAGFVDSVAGGGGLITWPVLLGVGVPVEASLATNKLQAVFGSASATWNYARLGTVSLRQCKTGIFCTVLGAAAGTLLVQHLDREFLRRALPALLLVIALGVLFKPQLGEKDIHPRMGWPWFYALAGLVFGFYDGFFGPGVGAFWTMAFMLGLGFNLTKATGYTKVMNFASNATSLLLFLWAGQVVWRAGLIMGAGELIGAKIGSGMVVSRGTKFIRPIFLTMVIALALKLSYDAWRK